MKVDIVSQWILGVIAVYFLALGLLRRENA
jgi:hypothetical protein